MTYRCTQYHPLYAVTHSTHIAVQQINYLSTLSNSFKAHTQLHLRLAWLICSSCCQCIVTELFTLMPQNMMLISNLKTIKCIHSILHICSINVCFFQPQKRISIWLKYVYIFCSSLQKSLISLSFKMQKLCIKFVYVKGVYYGLSRYGNQSNFVACAILASL